MADEPREIVDIPEWARVPLRRKAPPLRAGMTIEEAIAEGHHIALDFGNDSIIVDGNPMPLEPETVMHSYPWKRKPDASPN